MTLAVCLSCGSMKRGAFTPCPECNYDPSGDKDAAAKALVLTDHHTSLERLELASTKIKAGEEPDLDAQKLAELAAGLPLDGVGKMPIGCHIAVWTPVVVMIVLAVFVAYLYLVVLR